MPLPEAVKMNGPSISQSLIRCMLHSRDVRRLSLRAGVLSGRILIGYSSTHGSVPLPGTASLYVHVTALLDGVLICASQIILLYRYRKHCGLLALQFAKTFDGVNHQATINTVRKKL
jgi:hypothetical protein